MLHHFQLILGKKYIEIVINVLEQTGKEFKKYVLTFFILFIFFKKIYGGYFFSEIYSIFLVLFRF